MIRPRLPSPGALLREKMRDHLVVLPGVYDAITARLAQQAGAEALYLSGAGVTNALTALPDVGLLTLEEMARQANYITSVVSIPVIADADTGYGEVLNVMRAVRELERAGLAGIHLEDQVSPKRCGHLEGKQVVEPEAMVAKIRSALKARQDPSFLIIARTDARGVKGLQEAIHRGRLYASAGADGVFPEGLESREEFRAFRDAVPGPLLANMTEFGKTPLITAQEFRDLGYNLVIFPMTAFRVMMKAVGEAYQILLKEGSQKPLMDRMRTRQELYELIEYGAYEAIDRQLAEEAKKVQNQEE
jgi:methylisocitrate lyase